MTESHQARARIWAGALVEHEDHSEVLCRCGWLSMPLSSEEACRAAYDEHPCSGVSPFRVIPSEEFERIKQSGSFQPAEWSDSKTDASEVAHPVQALWDELDSLPDAAFAARRAERLRPTDRVSGIAFFPVGSGLWGRLEGGKLPPIPERVVMILGNNFASRANCDWVVANGGEDLGVDGKMGNVSKTWQQLLRLLENAGVRREDCFFTNSYMALVPGKSMSARLG